MALSESGFDEKIGTFQRQVIHKMCSECGNLATINTDDMIPLPGQKCERCGKIIS